MEQAALVTFDLTTLKNSPSTRLTQTVPVRILNMIDRLKTSHAIVLQGTEEIKSQKNSNIQRWKTLSSRNQAFKIDWRELLKIMKSSQSKKNRNRQPATNPSSIFLHIYSSAIIDSLSNIYLSNYGAWCRLENSRSLIINESLDRFILNPN